MSSYRIPKEIIKRSDEKMVINDQYIEDETLFKKSSIEEYLEESKNKIKKEEEKMLQELMEKKETMIQEFYEQGKERALEEAKGLMEKEYEEKLAEANEIYQKANEWFQGLIEESERIKEHYLQEKKEEVADFIVNLTEHVTNQSIEKEQIQMEKMYDKALEQVKYDTKKIYVRVHPSTQEQLKNYGKVRLDKRVELLFDLTILPGDFYLETEREFVDSSIQTQLENMRHFLRGVVDAEY